MKSRLFVPVITAIAGIIGGSFSTAKTMENKINDKQELVDKNNLLYLLMNQWVKVKQEGKNLSSYFEQHGYKSIAIYGMSYTGNTLVNELKDSDILIRYGIDQNANWLYADFPLITPDEEMEEVDAIVVTPIYYFMEIEERLSEKIQCPIVSIEEILYEV